VHLALITATPFQHVTETIGSEVYLVNELPLTVIVINFPPASGEFFLVIPSDDLNVIGT
jgi:hypothetical protein